MSSSESSSMERRPFEGQLNKFTNLVKGWQYRWMILDPESGYLSYYACAEDKYDSTRPVRGSGHLAGAYIVPSQEDSTAFSVDFASGETFKLRANNVRERQIWVDKLRSVAQSHDKALTAVSSASPPIREYLPPTPPGSRSQLRLNGEPTEALQNLSLSILDALGSVHSILHACNVNHKELVKAVESSPNPLDGDTLLLKSTSTSALLCLESALLMIQDIHENQGKLSLKQPNESRLQKTPNPSIGSPKKGSNLSGTPCSTSNEEVPLSDFSPTRSSIGSAKETLKAPS
eukprot:TRINITY_DN8437_c0_g1_i1.p1 TRINITY_DN8437_c0_g1~~TRINITY_DN8437_c0_g1_i1.p1  ORF type:complete len:301 (+),score=102.37 TRINITY_DN8437_c0_g1_i1:37-903(+)